MKDFDVLVVGAGHAGIEAAAAAARIGCKVAVITLAKTDIGKLSCNPSIGGIGKGHIVREIDALDGLMPQIADYACIHSRMLNSSRGPAVWGPRVQVDRKLYSEHAYKLLSSIDNLEIIYAEVKSLLVENSKVIGLVTSIGTLLADAVIITTGTFLGGVIHIGKEQIRAGRLDDQAVSKLAVNFSDLGLKLGRLKTGTPPRIARESINYDILACQPTEEQYHFSSYKKYNASGFVDCYLTRTNSQSHELIRRHLSESAIYSGVISSTGPRYCPSIEDKVVRFADKSSHQVFLEPEGLDSNLVYPNGISTSLSRTTQKELVNSLTGLESAIIEQPGYAIEYYYQCPKNIKSSLESKRITNLFFAGQINGTTGYEEAAGQGLIAGINAAMLSVGGETLNVSRGTCYLGVMINDITTRGVTEPYRVFTSRAENRLNLRIDNANDRLYEYGKRHNCLSKQKIKSYNEEKLQTDAAIKLLQGRTLNKAERKSYNIAMPKNGEVRNLLELATEGKINLSHISKITGNYDISKSIYHKVYSNSLYKRRKLCTATEKNLDLANVEWTKIPSLSNEISNKLSKINPTSWEEIKNIEGMTDAGLTAVSVYLAKAK